MLLYVNTSTIWFLKNFVTKHEVLSWLEHFFTRPLFHTYCADPSTNCTRFFCLHLSSTTSNFCPWIWLLLKDFPFATNVVQYWSSRFFLESWHRWAGAFPLRLNRVNLPQADLVQFPNPGGMTGLVTSEWDRTGTILVTIGITTTVLLAPWLKRQIVKIHCKKPSSQIV